MGERFPESEQPTSNTAGVAPSRGGRAAWSRVKILIRRVHLYTGLFLLPWVFLYGITGAMFNHQGLFPEVAIQEVDTSELSGYAFADFPTSEGLAQQVVESLQAAAGDHSISLAQDHGAEFTNPVMLLPMVAMLTFQRPTIVVFLLQHLQLVLLIGIYTQLVLSIKQTGLIQLTIKSVTWFV